jgi:hypothetical protein
MKGRIRPFISAPFLPLPESQRENLPTVLKGMGVI